MSLETYVRQLFEELEMGPLTEKDQIGQNPLVFTLSLDDDITLSLKEGEPGLFLSAAVAPTPKEDMNKMAERLMEGNLFGIETRGAKIGMSMDGEQVVLQLEHPYEMSYSAFRDSVEDFANLIVYWRTEILTESA